MFLLLIISLALFTFSALAHFKTTLVESKINLERINQLLKEKGIPKDIDLNTLKLASASLGAFFFVIYMFSGSAQPTPTQQQSSVTQAPKTLTLNEKMEIKQKERAKRLEAEKAEDEKIRLANIELYNKIQKEKELNTKYKLYYIAEEDGNGWHLIEDEDSTDITPRKRANYFCKKNGWWWQVSDKDARCHNTLRGCNDINDFVKKPLVKSQRPDAIKAVFGSGKEQTFECAGFDPEDYLFSAKGVSKTKYPPFSTRPFLSAGKSERHLVEDELVKLCYTKKYINSNLKAIKTAENVEFLSIKKKLEVDESVQFEVHCPEILKSRPNVIFDVTILREFTVRLSSSIQGTEEVFSERRVGLKVSPEDIKNNTIKLLKKQEMVKLCKEFPKATNIEGRVTILDITGESYTSGSSLFHRCI